MKILILAIVLFPSVSFAKVYGCRFVETITVITQKEGVAQTLREKESGGLFIIEKGQKTGVLHGNMGASRLWKVRDLYSFGEGSKRGEVFAEVVSGRRIFWHFSHVKDGVLSLQKFNHFAGLSFIVSGFCSALEK